MIRAAPRKYYRNWVSMGGMAGKGVATDVHTHQPSLVHAQNNIRS